MKKIFISLSLAIVMLVSYLTMYNAETEFLTTKIFETKNGFGYSIQLKGKDIIKQEYIPAIQDQKSFRSKKDAQKIAILVKEKLMNNKPPRITIKELKQQQIHF